MAYTIPKAQPFIIHGEKGDYLIPAMSTLSTDDMGDILTMVPDTPAAEKVAHAKAFLLRMAPDLEKEDLGDWGYFQIYMAYEKEQNPGK